MEPNAGWKFASGAEVANLYRLEYEWPMNGLVRELGKGMGDSWLSSKVILSFSMWTGSSRTGRGDGGRGEQFDVLYMHRQY